MYERSVKDVMSRELITCAATTPLEQVMQRLVDYTIHAIVVIDEAGYAVGIVSQTDVLQAQRRIELGTASKLTAGDIMSCEVITCSAETSLLDAVTLMTRNHIHRLVVAKPNTSRIYPLGVISMTDVIRFVIRDTASSPPALYMQPA